jgi:dTDP-glucose 4,6-dehydratase
MVIGSNSFSGASFARFLLKQGVEVIGTSRSEEPHPAFLPYRWDGMAAGFDFHRLDLNYDLDAIMALVRERRVSCIVNFAAQSMVAESWAHPEHWFQTNLVATVRLHDQLRKLDFLERYVHITTPEVYGSTEGPVGEDAPFNPSTPYAVSRAAADMSLRSFFSAYDFPVVFTRAANVYGPGQQLYRIIPRTIIYILLGKTLSLHGGGRSTRSFIHIDDVSEATWRITTAGTLGEAYHISTPNLISIRQLVELICQKLGADFNKAVDIGADRLGKDMSYRLECSKIRSELGWTDKIPLEKGIDETIQWVTENIDTLRKIPLHYIHKP